MSRGQRLLIMAQQQRENTHQHSAKSIGLLPKIPAISNHDCSVINSESTTMNNENSFSNNVSAISLSTNIPTEVGLPESSHHTYSITNLEPITINSVNSSNILKSNSCPIVITVPAEKGNITNKPTVDINDTNLEFASLGSDAEVSFDEHIFDNITILESQHQCEQMIAYEPNKLSGEMNDFFNEDESTPTQFETTNKNISGEHQSEQIIEQDPTAEDNQSSEEINDSFNVTEQGDKSSQPETSNNNTDAGHQTENKTQPKRKKRHHVNPATWNVNKNKEQRKLGKEYCGRKK
ncbi:hypothetical protein J6590_085010 [Homalodisca vitripennis]|nr:hypothetical protein J6590_085010 [Homalodisca vitripennis]